jgi:hypothetical protein
METKVSQAPRRRRPTIKRVPHQKQLTWPTIDTALTTLLARPRLLQIAAALIGVALLLLTLRAPLWEETSTSSPKLEQPRPAIQPAPAAPAGTDEQIALNTVALYNQASIDAAAGGRPDAMAPFLAADSRVWADIQSEYKRRAARREGHEPTLTRWGVLQIAFRNGIATIETQEQWDDITKVDGQVLSSKRGILTRNTYTLRRDAGASWLITEITTTTIIN